MGVRLLTTLHRTHPLLLSHVKNELTASNNLSFTELLGEQLRSGAVDIYWVRKARRFGGSQGVRVD